jgi:hypothetical protein
MGPNIEEINRRYDIQFTGKEACGIAKREYNVTVVSLLTRYFVANRFPPNISRTYPEERVHALIANF